MPEEDKIDDAFADFRTKNVEVYHTVLDMLAKRDTISITTSAIATSRVDDADNADNSMAQPRATATTSTAPTRRGRPAKAAPKATSKAAPKTTARVKKELNVSVRRIRKINMTNTNYYLMKFANSI